MRSLLRVLVVLAFLLAALATSSCETSQASGTVVRVGSERGVALVEAGGHTLLDLRTPAEYDAGHVAGAVNVDASAEDFEEEVAALDPAARYLVYSRSKRQSRVDADRMAAAGIERVVDAGAFGLLALAGAPLEE